MDQSINRVHGSTIKIHSKSISQKSNFFTFDSRRRRTGRSRGGTLRGIGQRRPGQHIAVLRTQPGRLTEHLHFLSFLLGSCPDRRDKSPPLRRDQILALGIEPRVLHPRIVPRLPPMQIASTGETRREICMAGVKQTRTGQIPRLLRLSLRPKGKRGETVFVQGHFGPFRRAGHEERLGIAAGKKPPTHVLPSQVRVGTASAVAASRRVRGMRFGGMAACSGHDKRAVGIMSAMLLEWAVRGLPIA